jgi:hypothetical protein
MQWFDVASDQMEFFDLLSQSTRDNAFGCPLASVSICSVLSNTLLADSRPLPPIRYQATQSVSNTLLAAL